MRRRCRAWESWVPVASSHRESSTETRPWPSRVGLSGIDAYRADLGEGPVEEPSLSPGAKESLPVIRAIRASEPHGIGLDEHLLVIGHVVVPDIDTRVVQLVGE